jgi:MoxR-like ATPase
MQVLSTDELLLRQGEVDRVYVDPAIYDYSVRLASATRMPALVGLPDLGRFLSFGASPRASINLVLSGRALAYLRGRPYVLPQDILDLSHDVMRHRLVLSFEAYSEGMTSDAILDAIIGRVPVPSVALERPPDARFVHA